MRKLFIWMSFIYMSQGFTQQRPVEGIWTTLNVPVEFNTRWQMHNDASYRTLGWGPSSLQYLYRPGIRYMFKPTFSVAAGTAFFFTRTTFDKTNEEFGYEFRTWQEVLRKFEMKHETEFQIRFRSEQRFFRPTERSPESRTAHRFRLRGSVIKKVNDHWSLQISDEYFRQVNNENFEFDQNRVLVTAIRHLHQGGQLQLGYMWLRWPNSSQHIISIGYQKKLKLYGIKHESR